MISKPIEWTDREIQLLKNVDKLQADAEYIEQAKAINSTIGTLIDLETVKIKTLMMLTK